MAFPRPDQDETNADRPALDSRYSVSSATVGGASVRLSPRSASTSSGASWGPAAPPRRGLSVHRTGEDVKTARKQVSEAHFHAHAGVCSRAQRLVPRVVKGELERLGGVLFPRDSLKLGLLAKWFEGRRVTFAHFPQGRKHEGHFNLGSDAGVCAPPRSGGRLWLPR